MAAMPYPAYRLPGHFTDNLRIYCTIFNVLLRIEYYCAKLS
ncbi:hypothetical protein HMPREF0208_00931 [Citrobacter koseri]|nr:hypothetical protein HMPREF0208_00931 [Citrobacter koseri]